MTQEGNTLRVKIKRTNDEVATKDGTRCSPLLEMLFLPFSGFTCEWRLCHSPCGCQCAIADKPRAASPRIFLLFLIELLTSEERESPQILKFPAQMDTLIGAMDHEAPNPRLVDLIPPLCEHLNWASTLNPSTLCCFYIRRSTSSQACSSMRISHRYLNQQAMPTI